MDVCASLAPFPIGDLSDTEHAILLAVLFPRMLPFVALTDVDNFGWRVFQFIEEEFVLDCLYGPINGCDKLKALLTRTQLAKSLLIRLVFRSLEYVEDGVDLLEALEGKSEPLVTVEHARAAMRATTQEIMNTLDAGAERESAHPLSDAVIALARR